ncbi:MAG: M28 family peptidase [Anaerolineae bacterium]
MASRRVSSWLGQAALFLALALLFSALPFGLALLLDKSSLGLALFITWYTLVPPISLLLLAWLLYHRERHWLSFAGRAWIGVGIWFLVQYVLGLASGVHAVVQLLNFPAIAAGGAGFLAGMMLFLVGGVVLVVVGDRMVPARVDGQRRKLFLGSTIPLLTLVVVGLPVFVGFTSRLPTAPTFEGAQVPAEDEIFGWIEDIYNFGVRRPGSEADLQAIDYLQDKLREFGFTDVHAEPFTFDYWEPISWSVIVHPGTDQAEELESFYVPYSGPTAAEGVEAELIYVGPGAEEDFAGADVAGKILLVDLLPVNISWDKMALFSFMAFDPDGTAEGWEHPYPIGWLFQFHDVYERAAEHDVAGIVGILHGYPEMGDFTYYAPYDGVLRPIPSLYVMEEDGEELKAALEEEAISARLVLEAEVARGGGETATVYGVLPGRSDTNIVVHSHHDAPWPSGIEDSSGVGMVLGLAKYFSQVPPEQRERTLIFMFTGSHMVGAPSNEAFIEEHRGDILANMLFDVCIEHIADDYNPPAPPTGMVEPRGTFITENPVVVSLYARAVARHAIYRTLVFPTGTPLGVPTDAGTFQRAGYPVVSLISGPTWLFDDDDTLDRVARDQLVPLTEMYVDFIAGLGSVGEPLLRFNLNTWTIAFVALVLTPLAALSGATWPRGEGE